MTTSTWTGSVRSSRVHREEFAEACRLKSRIDHQEKKLEGEPVITGRKLKREDDCNRPPSPKYPMD